MPTESSSALQIVTVVAPSALLAYFGGRFHQWYKHGMDRDHSFREGFRHGYQALFPVASRGRTTDPGQD